MSEMQGTSFKQITINLNMKYFMVSDMQNLPFERYLVVCEIHYQTHFLQQVSCSWYTISKSFEVKKKN